jgi:hypothetical protein
LYDRQLCDVSRFLVLIVVFCGGQIHEDELKSVALRFIGKGVSGRDAVQKWDDAMRLSVGSILTRSIGGWRGVTISLFNPSVADFVIGRYLNEREVLVECAKLAESIDILKTYEDLFRGRKLPLKVYVSVLSDLLGVDYSSKLFEFRVARYAALVSVNKRDYWELIGREIASGTGGMKLQDKIVITSYLVDVGIILSSVDSKDLVLDLLEDCDDHDEFILISSLIVLVDKKWGIDLRPNFCEAVVEYWEGNADSEAENYDIFSDFTGGESDFDSAYESAEDFLSDRFREYSINVDAAEWAGIVDDMDISGVLENNAEIEEEDDGERPYRPAVKESVDDSDASIRDLFERE